MASKLILTLTLCLLVLGSFAQLRPGQSREGEPEQQKCDIQRLIASEPSRSVKSEGGVVDIWEHNTSEFRCTGFVALRSTTHPGGLLVPSYTIAPYLTFIEQGSGVQSMIMQGCPETFQSGDESEAEYSIGQHSRPRRERRLGGERNQYQKVFRIRKGDVIAAPAGAVQWTHNDGDTDLVRVSLIDSYSFHNQLDENVRSFFLSGRRQSVGSGSQQQRSKSHQAWTGGVLSGLDDGILREIFPGTEPETIRKLKGNNDKRGSIVHAGVLNITVLEEESPLDQQGRGSSRNNVYGGGDDCSLKFKHNIDSPAHADVFNQGAGRINTVNSKSLPILKRLGLSAQHVVLYRNAIIGPRWNQNAHSALYVIKGGGRAQVVGDEGNTVFDNVLQRGQILVIPQGFALVVKAGPEGLEWVDVKTSDNPITSPIVGGTSLLRAIPAEVLACAFDISMEEALKLKNARREVDVSVRLIPNYKT